MSAHHHFGKQFTGYVVEPIKCYINNIMPIFLGHHEHKIILSYARVIYEICYIIIRMLRLPFVNSRSNILFHSHIKLQNGGNSTNRLYFLKNRLSGNFI